MGSLGDAPAVVLVAFTLAAILFLVEVALPTFGVAGLSSLALAGLGLLAASDQDRAWWPLVLVAAGVCLWAVLLGARRAGALSQVVATGLFGIGGVGYGVLAEDPLTIGLALAGAAALSLSFRPLLRVTTNLHDLRPQTGMEALVGTSGRVVSWENDQGSVRISGSLWNARSHEALSAGDEVEVTGYAGLRVEVSLRRQRRPLPSA